MKKLTICAILLAVALPALAQDHPFVVTSPVNSSTPFNVTLPATLPDGKAVKTVVIEFITADCNAGVGVNSIGAAKLGVFFAGNFAIYTLPFEQPMSFVNATEFVSTQKTLIFADPGSPLSYGLSAGQPTCTVVFSGHLL
ncbi:MAG TPA: hypothetical protein VI488_14030 [Candidatus Angelobacter sp.]